jgi:hypothetical protein
MSTTGGLRYRICPDCGDLHDKYEWPDNHRRPDEVLCAPSVISDSMPAIQSMVDGRMYDSKAAIRAGYREAGKRDGREYAEVGNDPARHKKFTRQPTDKKAISEAVHRAAQQFNAGKRTDYGRQLELVRPGAKPPTHIDPAGPKGRSGVFKPAF